MQKKMMMDYKKPPKKKNYFIFLNEKTNAHISSRNLVFMNIIIINHKGNNCK